MTERLFEHVPHPHVHLRLHRGPVRTKDVAPGLGPVGRFNARLANIITGAVGTMYCFYLFNLLASASAMAALTSGDLVTMVGWVSSNWIQLVLLPALMVGQNIAATAADRRAEATYDDAEAVLHEAQQIQHHLQVQDEVLTELIASLRWQDTVLARMTGATPPETDQG